MNTVVNKSYYTTCLAVSGSLGLGTLGSHETVSVASFADDEVRCWNEILQVQCHQWQELTFTAVSPKLTLSWASWHLGFGVAGPMQLVPEWPAPGLVLSGCSCPPSHPWSSGSQFAFLLSESAIGHVNARCDTPPPWVCLHLSFHFREPVQAE